VFGHLARGRVSVSFATSIIFYALYRVLSKKYAENIIALRARAIPEIYF
jgi:hypothetical protein